MLTGRTAFAGKSHASLIGSILKDTPPPLSSVQPLAPPLLDHIVQRCLAKEPDERWQTAADVMRELKWLSATSGALTAAVPMPARSSAIASMGGRERAAWATAAVLLLVSGIIMIDVVRPESPPETAPFMFSVEPPPGIAFSTAGVVASHPTISPDGQQLAFAVHGPDGRGLLAVRRLDNLETRILPGTESASLPFWSPDSRTLAFFSGGQLKRIGIQSGAVQTIASRDIGDASGGSWNREGIVLFAGPAGALYRVSATGGEPTAVTTVEKSENEVFHRLPWFLPDGRRFLYLAQPSNTVFEASLDSSERKSLVRADSKALYSPTGHLLFMRGITLDGTTVRHRSKPDHG
jgi:hypothetical protein